MAMGESSRRKPRARWLMSQTVEFMPSKRAFDRPSATALAMWSRWVSMVSAHRMNGSSSLTHAA